jgi:nucleolar MIF4G domain-containing protein 1
MYLPSKTQTFVELFLVTVILSSQQTTSKHREEVPLQHIFAPAKDLPGLVQGLLYFLRKVMRRSEVTSTKHDKVTVKWGCKVIEGLLTADTGETTEV